MDHLARGFFSHQFEKKNLGAPGFFSLSLSASQCHTWGDQATLTATAAWLRFVQRRAPFPCPRPAVAPRLETRPTRDDEASRDHTGGQRGKAVAARNPRPSAVCGWPRSHLRSSTLVMQRLADRSDDIFMACAAAGYAAQCPRPGNDGGGSGVLNKQSARVLERSHSTGRGAREGIYLRCRRGLTCTARPPQRGAWCWHVLCKYGTQMRGPVREARAGRVWGAARCAPRH